MEKNLDEMSLSELGELATQEVLEHIKTIKPTPDPPYIGRDLLGYRYNKKHPPMFDIHKHDFHGYATDSQETFFYNFAVQGYDVSFRYKGQMHYLMYDKGKAAVCDEHFTKQYIVYPDPNALIEQYEIDGHKLIEIIDELEEVEAV